MDGNAGVFQEPVNNLEGNLLESAIIKRLLLSIAILLCAISLRAATPMLKKEAEVPPELAFVRSLDLDTYAERTNDNGLAQTARLRLRLLDPDVNAFVGLVGGFHHFDEELTSGSADSLETSRLLTDWGGVFGIVRGAHLWELDVEGATLGPKLGFAAAIAGEHRLSPSWTFYHRLEPNFFVGDTVIDGDTGFYWMLNKSLGFSLGYRLFASQHMNRNGPHAGVRVYFESPKIPFIFPSLG
jgi:hypothetical protein